jgi:hypothetical protein
MAEPEVTLRQWLRTRWAIFTPLNPHSAHELTGLKSTVAQLPPSFVVTRTKRQRCGPGYPGSTARRIAIRVLPVAARLATAAAGEPARALIGPTVIEAVKRMAKARPKLLMRQIVFGGILIFDRFLGRRVSRKFEEVQLPRVFRHRTTRKNC